jgi:hypothetical protein
LWKRNHYTKASRWFWGKFKRIGRHLYRQRIYRRWNGGRWITVRKYWHLYRKNKYNHAHHGRHQWRWGGYKRIGVHRYRLRILWRNVQGQWKRVRAYWHLWKRNHYYKKPRWHWGAFRKVGYHQYRQRILKRWTGARWVVKRKYWKLWRKNKYRHKLHGKYKWFWGKYKRIGRHLYRRRILRRFWHRHWRHVRSYWHMYKRNHYYRPFRWYFGKTKRIGRHLYRLRILKRWDGRRWVVIRGYWQLYRKNHFKHKLHGKYRWYWGRYKRIGHHLYRKRTLRRFWHSSWRHVRSYWHLWRRGTAKRPRWSWGRFRRIGRHLYRLRILKRWTGKRWVVKRRYWHLYRRNHYPVRKPVKKKVCPCCNTMKGFAVKLIKYKRKCARARTFCSKMRRHGRYTSVCKHMMALCRRTR